MIDIKFLRENPEAVKENIRKKFQDDKLPLVDEVIENDAIARKAQQEADEIRANKKKASKQIGALMAQGKKEEAIFEGSDLLYHLLVALVALDIPLDALWNELASRHHAAASAPASATETSPR